MGGQPDMDKLIAEIQKLSAKIDEQEEARKHQQNESDVLKTLKNKLTIGNSKEEASKKPICFKCQGLGHVSKVCPNLLWLLGKNIIIF
ncbi:Protein transport protein SEC31 [Bienertia sinuspersici]